MTDQNPSPRASAREASPEGRNWRIPPLVWIVLAILVAWFVVIAVRRHGVDVTPHGGTMPRAPESTAYMPSSPAHGGAPATPGGTVNGPQQPLSSDAPPR